MYPFNLKLQGLLVKEESTYGTDAAPSNTVDGVKAKGSIYGSLSFEWAFPNERDDVVSNSLIQAAPGAPRGRLASMDISIPLIGAGAAYSSVTPVRPEMDPLLMACAMSRTHVDTVSSESVSYALTDTGHSSCTVWAYAAGKLYKIVGCRGTWTWEPEAGTLGSIRFQLQGMLSTAPTEVAVPTITYSTVIAPAAVGMGLALVPNGQSSWTPNWKGLSVMSGHELDRFDDGNAADGVEGFEIGSTKPRFSFTPRVEDLSDYAAHAHAASRLDHTIDFTLGSTQYNRAKLDVNLAYLLTDPEPDEDGNFAAYKAEYLCRDMAILFD